MKPLKLVTVVGARPQLIKAAAVSRAIVTLNGRPAGGGPALEEYILHTGQHYDHNMSQIFFEELGIPEPSINLGVGSGSHGRQTGLMLEGIESALLTQRPDWVLIYGDTNSTLAAALAASKLNIPIAHVEAGLRSYNRAMPEEINRVVADALSTLLLCPSDQAVENLTKEGIERGVSQVGDVMYDSVLHNLDIARRRTGVLERLGVEPRGFYLATVHRAENTDVPSRLEGILAAFRCLDRPVLLPLHPRTRKILGARVDRLIGEGLRIIEPLSYLNLLNVAAEAQLVLTDSGGLQKEAFWLGVPCVTLRDETEWVELVAQGCNAVVGASTERILEAVADFEAASCRLPDTRDAHIYGDGHTAEAIAAALAAGPPSRGR